MGEMLSNVTSKGSLNLNYLFSNVNLLNVISIEFYIYKQLKLDSLFLSFYLITLEEEKSTHSSSIVRFLNSLVL